MTQISRDPDPKARRAQRCRRRRFLLWGMTLLGCLIGWTSAAEAQKSRRPNAPTGIGAPESMAVGERQQLWLELGRRIRGGDLDAARMTARRFLSLYPGDAAMTYNLACLEARLGHDPEAWQALDEAFTQGFTDLHLIQEDPDLGALRSQERFQAWLAASEDQLRRRSQARGLVLQEGNWSDEIVLQPSAAADMTGDSLRVSIKLQSSSHHLMITAQVAAPFFRDRTEPWRNGDGLVVSVVVPPAADAYESRRFFSCGFGLEGNLPVGALIARHGQPLLQRIVELDPKIRIDPAGGEARYSLAIPWDLISPYGPPLDAELGLNVSYLHVRSDGAQATVALMDDPNAHLPDRPWRRYAPVRFEPGARPEPVLRGRVGDAVVTAQPLEIQLVAQAPAAGRGVLAVEIQDAAGRSVLSGGPLQQDVDITAGTNRWTRAADMTALPSGPFNLRAKVTLPDGPVLTWQTPLLRYRDDWAASVRSRLAAVPELEKPAVLYRLDAVVEAIRNRNPYDDPSPVGTTLQETDLMLQYAAERGTVLPDSGLVIMAFEDRGRRLHPFALSLPARQGEEQAPDVLLLLSGTAGQEAWLALHTTRAVTSPRAPIVLAPYEREPGRSRGDLVLGDAIDAIAWARDRFGTGKVLVAGLDRGAADALHLSLRQPATCAGVLLLTGAEFDPWPGRSREDFVKILKTRPNQLAYSLFRFPEEAGAGDASADLVAAMRETGFRLQDVREIPGGLSRSQAVSLAAAWVLDRSN
jgi:pimeloyl-ACP methyl ester carboxylesterase